VNVPYPVPLLLSFLVVFQNYMDIHETENWEREKEKKELEYKKLHFNLFLLADAVDKTYGYEMDMGYALHYALA
jgi:hypothetical protein